MASKFTISARSCSFLLLLSASLLVPARAGVFDITQSGGSAGSDVTQALQTAWKSACGAGAGSSVVVPAGQYSLGEVVMAGPCAGPVTLQIDGTLTAPGDAAAIKGPAWITLLKVDKLTITGKGTLDGQGSNAWAESGGSHDRPANLRLDALTDATVDGITSLNSKMFHITVLMGKGVTLNNLIITAPGDSPNTDGIHISRSDGVTITGPTIKTGDDCVSIGEGSTNILISGVTCGPGHGLSVGSLGKVQNEAPVSGITIRDSTLTNTEFGLRVKTWPGSPAGTASDIHFSGITMNGVQRPILIDQTYCPHQQCKSSAPSNVKLSNLSFQNIKGTSATADVVQLHCSPSSPCEGVSLGDITVAPTGGTANAVCSNVQPTISGQFPSGCSGAQPGPATPAASTPASPTATAPTTAAAPSTASITPAASAPTTAAAPATATAPTTAAAPATGSISPAASAPTTAAAPATASISPGASAPTTTAAPATASISPGASAPTAAAAPAH